METFDNTIGGQKREPWVQNKMRLVREQVDEVVALDEANNCLKLCGIGGKGSK